jgi:hypothetical protein
LYDLQDVLLGDDPDAAANAVVLSMCGGRIDPEELLEYEPDLNGIQASIYDELV